MKKPISFWEKVLWTDETKINMFQSDSKRTVWRRAKRQKTQRTTLHLCETWWRKWDSLGMYMAAKGPGDLIFIEDMTETNSPIMGSNTYRKHFGNHIGPNGKKLVGRGFVVQSDNDPKHTRYYQSDTRSLSPRKVSSATMAQSITRFKPD